MLWKVKYEKNVQMSTSFTVGAFSEATISYSSTRFTKDGMKNYVDINNRYV